MFVHEWFAKTATTRPNRPAIEAGDQQLSYSALLSHARRTAEALRSHGTAKGDRVALLLGNRVAAITAIIGCLEAECVFVPLAVADPVSRSRMLLELAATAWCLADQSASSDILQGWHPVGSA